MTPWRFLPEGLALDHRLGLSAAANVLYCDCDLLFFMHIIHLRVYCPFRVVVPSFCSQTLSGSFPSLRKHHCRRWGSATKAEAQTSELEVTFHAGRQARVTHRGYQLDMVKETR